MGQTSKTHTQEAEQKMVESEERHGLKTAKAKQNHL